MGKILPADGSNCHRESKVLGSYHLMNNGTLDLNSRNLPRIDDVDRKIIGELTEDGRVSFAELGRRVSLSSPAVAERVQRLERAGVITGYRAEIDPRALGYQLTAIVRIKPAPGQLPRIPELAAQIPEVGECHRITGEDCFYLKGAPSLDRRAQRPPRPLPGLRRDHDVPRQRFAHPSARPAAPGPRRRRLTPNAHRAIKTTDRRGANHRGRAPAPGRVDALRDRHGVERRPGPRQHRVLRVES